MIDIIIVGAYLLLTLLLGMVVAKSVKSSNEYQTGGRDYPAWMVFATLSASFIGGGFTIGLAEKTYIYGIVYVMALWGFSFKELLIATVIAPRMKRFKDALTVGDIMEQSFGIKTKVIAGIASMLVCGGIIGAQVCACGNIMYTFIGLPQIYGSLLAAGIVVIYATYGGMKSVVAVDILHFAVLIVMLPIVMVFGLNAAGGLNGLKAVIPPDHLQPLGSIGIMPIIVLFVSFFLGETLIPPYMQRLLIGKTINETKRGTLWSGILSIPFFLLIGVIGLVAMALTPELPPHLALPHVIKTVMPTGLKGLAIAAMLAVVMSSADSFLNSTATAITNDVLLPLKIKPKTQRAELVVSRLITFVVGSVAIIFALTSARALDILLYSPFYL
jgi:SSS family solute:Na+ symporter